MTVRTVKASDIPTLDAMAKASGYPYPDVNSPRIEAAIIVEDDAGQPIMAVAAERIVQLYLYCGDARPAVKLSALRLIHDAMAKELKRQGYDSAEAFLPPEVEKPFAKRLEGLFSWRKNWNSWTRAF